MRVVLNYKSFLKSSATPMTPLYTGSWNPKFSTKWLGVAAELSYNPYLRNGWVAVDTGVKGGVGSPLIEFSTWEAEDSSYNIVIPNSFSYRFLARKDTCSPQFLARSSVEASEWWFIADGHESILNLWGRKLSSANRLRARFKAITYLNYRFRNLNSPIISSLAGAITPDLNKVLGLSSEDVRFRDLSINFLYLNKLARHRVARIRFFLYERGTVSNFRRNFGYRNVLDTFADQFFFRFLQNRMISKTGVISPFVVEDFQFFSRTSLTFFSFEHLIGNLSATIFFFLEFRGSSVLVSFFLVLMRRLIDQLISLFAVSLFPARNLTKQSLLQLSAFVVRRLVNFLLTTYLSAYSFLILSVYAVRDFVLRTLSSIDDTCKHFGGTTETSLVELYSYKLRQLASSFSINLLSKNTLNTIFPTNRVSTSTVLREYAKHRGRGLRLFRRRRNLLRRKKKFNFVGRWPKNYFYKKRGSSLDEDAGFTFSRRLYQLRRILKCSSSGGQFTFLFFWSFQFFNFSQLNLKKRKFFFLAMRLAYFFKSFFRFFKFYAFYFKVLREWDLVGHDLYSNTDNFAVNLKTYCALLFLKFGRVLLNFKLFCEKIFFLKWKRFCAASLNDIQNERRARITSFNWVLGGSTSKIVRSTAALTQARKGLAPMLSTKFLSWSYGTFTGISAIKTMSDVAISSRHYLKYLLKVRLMHVKLYMNRVGYALQNLMVDSSQFSEVSRYTLEASLSSWFARSLWKLPLRWNLMSVRSGFLRTLGRVLSTSTTLIFLHNSCLYVKRNQSGLVYKISPVYTRTLFRRCLKRRRRLKRWSLTVPVFKPRGNFFLAGCRKFVSSVRGAAELNFTAVAARVSRFTNNSVRLATLSTLFFVKRFLLTWKLLARSQIQRRGLTNSKFGGALMSSQHLAFLLPYEVERSKLLNLLRERSISEGFRRYRFSEFNPKKLVLAACADDKARQEQFFAFNLAEIERTCLGAMYSVFRLGGGLMIKPTLEGSLFNKNRHYFGRSGVLFTTLTGRRFVNTMVKTPTAFEVAKMYNSGAARIFLVIWGLYLTTNTWSTGALGVASYNLYSEIRLASLLLTYNSGFIGKFNGTVFNLFLTSSAYLRTQFAVLKSLGGFRFGVLRGAVFNSLTGIYLQAYFFRNFFAKTKHTPFVVNAALLPLRLFSANSAASNLISFKTIRNIDSWFGGLVLARVNVQTKYFASSKLNTFIRSFADQSVRKPCVSVEGDLYFNRDLLVFNGSFVVPAHDNSLMSFTVLRNRRTAASSLRASSLLFTDNMLERFRGLRLSVVSRVWRTYCWIKRTVSQNGFYSAVSLSTRNAVVNYLKNILWLVVKSNPISAELGLGGLSSRTYSWRVGRFFNLVRSMHPLKLLVYAKKMGIWPKHLRLRPKKVKQKRVFEINPSKNKQSLVPDKNFKMPPSIFSRDNYESMNLILDFPNEDYRFAKINTYKWVRAWRFTRNLAARRLMVFLRRRLRVRYFKRTFRYRRFLRKRWFRNRLKKIAYRALIRASTKLRVLYSLKTVYRGGACLRFFSGTKLYYSPVLTHSLILARFFRGLSAKFLHAKVTLRLNFMRALKLQFLFLLSVSFFKKMLTFFTSFVWAYRMTFSGDISFGWCFNKLNSLWLTAVRMYSLGASYYWTEPLALFNTKLLLNYTEEGFFKIRRLSDFFVIRTIGPDYYPYHTLIAALPWRTDNVQVFQPYNTFLTSYLFRTTVARFVLATSDLRGVFENFNVFADVLNGEFFETSGFRLCLPARRRGNKVVHARGIKSYTKPMRRAQIIRFLHKFTILKSRHRSKKMKLGRIHASRNYLSNLNYVDSSRSFFTSLLRLRPIYITLPKYGVKSKYYRRWCRVVRVIANAHRRARPARLNVTVGGGLHYCRTARRYIKWRNKVNPRFSKYPLRMHWRQRKTCSWRGVTFNRPAILKRAISRLHVKKRFGKRKRKQPALFSRRVYAQ